MNVPIIGQPASRSWHTVAVTLVHDDKPRQAPDHTLLFPTRNWYLRMMGHRSDGLLCETIAVLTDKETTPDNIALGLKQATRVFATYLNCACRPNAPCAQHAHIPQSRVSG